MMLSERRNSSHMKRRTYTRTNSNPPRFDVPRCSLNLKALSHYFVRGLANATRAVMARPAVVETGQRFPEKQMIDFSMNEGTKFRARRGIPLPDPKPTAKSSRALKSSVTRSPTSTIHIAEDNWCRNLVPIGRGMEPIGALLLAPRSYKCTGSIATTFAHTLRVGGSLDHKIPDLDILRQAGVCVTLCIPRLNQEDRRKA